MSMQIYFNENALIKSQDDLTENLKEIKDIYELSKTSNWEIWVKDNLDYTEIRQDRRYVIAAGILKKFKTLNTEGCHIVEQNEIDPEVDNFYFLELMSLCYRDRNQIICSLGQDMEVNCHGYRVESQAGKLHVKNIRGKDEFQAFLLHNPSPTSIEEVFERVEDKFQHIKFLEVAYKTAATRNDIYKTYGYGRILDAFKALEELVYPHQTGDLVGVSEDDLVEKFRGETKGTTFSRETTATMRKYGYQREVHVGGRKLTMTFHIKIADNRIYFIYDEQDDMIYIGHSGKHLSTVGEKGN